jgi:hypothetical protein
VIAAMALMKQSFPMQEFVSVQMRVKAVAPVSVLALV